MNNEDYQRIAEAISFIRQNHLDRPDLKTVAQHIGLSEYHFQKLFTQWAGISPKRFWQYLTLEYAKSRIDRTKNLLDLTLETGLSSPGRLHDLFVNIEAISPGEYKTGGRGLTIYYGIHDTLFGRCLIAKTTRGICQLHFLDSSDNPKPEAIIERFLANAEIKCDREATQSLCDRIFNPETLKEEKPLTLSLSIQHWMLTEP